MKVLPAQKAQLDQIVQCHAAVFPGEFMTAMGPRWLGELYRSHLDGEGGLALVAVDEAGTVHGLAVGGEDAIFEQFMRRAPKQFFFLILWKCLTHGIVRRKVIAQAILRLASLVRFRSPPPGPAEPGLSPKPRTGNLLSICVLPDSRGTGVADQLMEAFSDASRRAGFEVMHLYVHSDNRRAIGFYLKHGWKEMGQEGASTIFARDLRDPPG